MNLDNDLIPIKVMKIKDNVIMIVIIKVLILNQDKMVIVLIN